VKKPQWSYPAIFLLLLLSLVLCSCDDEGPIDLPRDPDCIGSAGGQKDVPDTNNPLHGVIMTVEPGVWDECWSVYFNYNSTFTTPNFPKGLSGYEGMLTGSLEMTIGRQVTHETWQDAPGPLDLDLTFPLRDLTVEPGEKLTAFRYDEEAGIYRLKFPEELDEKQMTISTDHHDALWTWGKVDLGEADFDTYLAPVMEEMHGAGVWLEIEAMLDSLRLAAIEDQREVTCNALNIVRGSLAAASETAAGNVRSIQDALNNRCGVCDATTPVFYEELSEYLSLKMDEFFIDLFLGDSKNLFLRIYGFIMIEYKRYCIEQLACDYECFADAVDAGFYYHLAIFYATTLTVELVDWAISSGYIDC
jgi:hypothetical protein